MYAGAISAEPMREHRPRRRARELVRDGLAVVVLSVAALSAVAGLAFVFAAFVG